MAVNTLVTRGYGNGTFSGTIPLVVTRGYTIGEIWIPIPQDTQTWTSLDQVTDGWILEHEDNKVLSLDGVSEYIVVANDSSLQPTTVLELEARVKSNTSDWNAYGSFIGKRPAYFLIPTPSTKEITFYIGSSGFYGVGYTATDITNYHTYKGVYDGVNMYIYEDDVLKHQRAMTLTIDNDTGDLYVGSDDLQANRYLNGVIDYVKVTINGEVVLNLQLNEGEGQSVRDSSGYGNDGEIIGGTWINKKSWTTQ